MNSPVQPYELLLEVLPGDIDQLNHVNNVVYLRWVQEAAVAHWTAAAPAQAQATLFWVVVRHEIDYLRPALAGDRILARTWVGPATRRSFERNTEILRAGDRALLARAPHPLVPHGGGHRPAGDGQRGGAVRLFGAGRLTGAGPWAIFPSLTEVPPCRPSRSPG